MMMKKLLAACEALYTALCDLCLAAGWDWDACYLWRTTEELGGNR